MAQSVFAGQGAGLKELAKLIDLDALVHIEEPLPGLFHGLLRRGVLSGFEIVASGQLNYEFPGQGRVQRVKLERIIPLGGEIS